METYWKSVWELWKICKMLKSLENLCQWSRNHRCFRQIAANRMAIPPSGIWHRTIFGFHKVPKLWINLKCRITEKETCSWVQKWISHLQWILTEVGTEKIVRRWSQQHPFNCCSSSRWVKIWKLKWLMYLRNRFLSKSHFKWRETI